MQKSEDIHDLKEEVAQQIKGANSQNDCLNHLTQLQLQPKPSPQTFVDTDLVNRYRSFFIQEMYFVKMKKIEDIDLESTLNHEGIRYNPQQCVREHVTLQKIRQSINSEVIVFQAQWRTFSMELSICNVIGKSKIHSKNCAMGAYGSIYQTSLLQSNFVIKCIPFEKQKSVGSAIYMGIKQYFIFKIASALRIGPAVKSPLGFDLILYEDCLQFAIEFCQGLNEINQTQHQQLVQSILLMHRLKIIHFDIKPENIMFSLFYNKPVFIDFGLSQIVEIQIGQKKEVFFRGTVNYCSEQMIKAFTLSQHQRIDLYYNDLFSFKSTLHELRPISEQDSQQSDSGEEVYYEYERKKKNDENSSKILLILIKYLLFQQDMVQLTRIFHYHSAIIHQLYIDDILTFFEELSPTQALTDFYRQEIQTYKKEGYKYKQLTRIYSKASVCFQDIPINQEKKAIYQSYYVNIKRIMVDDEFSSMRQDQIMSILQKNRKHLSSPQLFKLYVQIVSFTNNIHQSSMKKRRLATQLLLENHELDINIACKYQESTSNLKIITETLLNVYRKMLKIYRQVSPNRWQKQLFYDLLEHIFALDICRQIEIIQNIQLAYDQIFIKGEDKIQFIMKILHFSDWLRYRFKSQHKRQQIHTRYLRIQEWCFQRMVQLKETSTEKYQNIANYIVQHWRSINLNNIPSYIISILSQSHQLYNEIKKEAICIKITQDQTNNQLLLNQIYLLVANGQKEKLSFWTLKLIHIYCISPTNFIDFMRLQALFKKNLKCDVIFGQLIFSCAQQLFQKPENNIVYLQKLIQFYEECTFSMFALQSGFIFKTLKHHYLLNNLNKEQSSIAQKLQLFAISFKNIINLIDFNKLLQFWQKDKSNLHKCISLDNIRELFLIKHQYFKFMKDSHYLQGLMIDTKIIQERSYITQCLNCRNILIFLSKYPIAEYFLYQIKDEHKFQPDIEQKFIENWTLLRQYSKMNLKDIKTVNQHKMAELYEHLMSQVCFIHPKLDQQYKGILNYYYYIKDRDYFEVYFEEIDPSVNKILSTLFILYKFAPLSELTFFLTKLTGLMTLYNLSSQCFIFSKFINLFFISVSTTLDVMTLIKQLNKNQNIAGISPPVINSFNALYYFYLAGYIPNYYLNPFKWKLIKLISKTPIEVRRYFQIDYLIYHFKQLLKYQSFTNDQRSFIRKKSFVAQKMIRVTTILDTNKFVYEKKPKLRNKNIKIQKLMERGLSLGGPYNFGGNYSYLYVTIKAK